LANVLPGTYTLTVTDFVGCTDQVTVVIDKDTVNLLSITVDSVKEAACANASTGQVYVSVGGGHTPYTYSWSNGDTTKNLSDVIPGVYTLTVRDSVGCTAQVSLTVHADTVNQLAASVTSVVDAICSGTLHGEVNVSVSGGAAPYTYSWSNGSITRDLENVPAGNYTLM